jgi:hypothetical protein
MVMASSKDCHDNAARCVELANGAKTVATQNLFFEMARAWIEVAEQLEQDPALEERRGDVRLRVEAT